MRLSELDPESHLRDPHRRQRYVTTLFDTIEPGYDRFTRLFSFGMDRAWKRQLADWAGAVVRPGDLVLDLACGTGDVLEAMGRGNERPRGGDRAGIPVRLVGVDPSGGMLRIARRRFARDGREDSHSPSPDAPIPSPPPLSISLLRADMMSLPVADGAAAAVTVGYGFRNTPDAAGALQEVARVLRPGGWLFDLDFFRPERPGWRRLYLWYLRVAGRAVGRRWHAEPEAYGYIARSLEHWMTPPEFARALGSAGFQVERIRRHFGGGICLHAARYAP